MRNTGSNKEKKTPVGAELVSHLRQAIPGIDLMNVPDVVFSSEDGEQAGVGVIKLRKDNKLKT